jgi:hypothetical protein
MDKQSRLNNVKRFLLMQGFTDVEPIFGFKCLSPRQKNQMVIHIKDDGTIEESFEGHVVTYDSLDAMMKEWKSLQD